MICSCAISCRHMVGTRQGPPVCTAQCACTCFSPLYCALKHFWSPRVTLPASLRIDLPPCKAQGILYSPSSSQAFLNTTLTLVVWT